MITLRIGGVPEHFNLPWHLAIKEGFFVKHGIDLVWSDYPSGTGAMCQDLRSGKLDMAVLLTEGIVADIVKGNESSIVQWYVTSPLVWGIHVSSGSGLYQPEDLREKKYAISRLGSGSHIMAVVDAKERGWKTREDQFVAVGGLTQAVKALTEDAAQIFLWEKFMTKPLVDQGIFRRIGERPTPWPCFALAAGKYVPDEKSEAVRQIVLFIAGAQKRMENPDIPATIASRYGIEERDARLWLKATHWGVNTEIKREVLGNVMNTLCSLQLIQHTKPPETLISKVTTLV